MINGKNKYQLQFQEPLLVISINLLNLLYVILDWVVKNKNLTNYYVVTFTVTSYAKLAHQVVNITGSSYKDYVTAYWYSSIASLTIMCLFDFREYSFGFAVQCSIRRMFVGVVHSAESPECIVDFIFACLLLKTVY